MPIESYYDQIQQALHSMPHYTLLVVLCLVTLLIGMFLTSLLFRFRSDTRRSVVYSVSFLVGTALSVVVFTLDYPLIASKTQEVQTLTRHLCRDYVESARYNNIEAPEPPEEIAANAVARNISMLCYQTGVSARSLRSAFDSLAQNAVITQAPRWHTSQDQIVVGPRRL